jgi:hypothetical protein
MGYYIQVPDNTNKAGQIVKIYGAEIVPCPSDYNAVPKDKALICVVQNGDFDAAGFAYCEQEFQKFMQPDRVEPGGTEVNTLPNGTYVIEISATAQRPRTWLLMDWDKACKLTGFKVG